VPDECTAIPVIDTFTGEYLFLSNFAAAPTPHRGWLYPASEHAFAAAKTRDAAAIAAIRGTDDPAQAKRIGRAAPLGEGLGSGRQIRCASPVLSAVAAVNSAAPESTFGFTPRLTP